MNAHTPKTTVSDVVALKNSVTKQIATLQELERALNVLIRMLDENESAELDKIDQAGGT